jgi:hypothetical protein
MELYLYLNDGCLQELIFDGYNGQSCVYRLVLRTCACLYDEVR